MSITLTGAGRYAVGGTPAWSPADLPGLVAAPLVALMRSMGLLKQDLAGAVPAVAAGDPVRKWTCPFTGTVGTAPSDAARAVLYDEGSGKWSFQHDGVDDRSDATVSFPTASLTAAVALVWGTNPFAALALGTADYCGDLQDTVWQAQSGISNLLGTFTSSSGEAVRHVLRRTAAGATNYRNGTPNGALLTALAAPSTGTLTLGTRGDGAAPASCRIAGAVWCSQAISPSDVALLDAYLAALLS